MSEAAKLLQQLGGVQLSKLQAPFLHNKVERLAAKAKINKPHLYVILDNSPNACAVGLSDDDTAVAVTIGLLRNLDESEIEAVLAHEIGHIQKSHCIEKTQIAMKAMAISVVAATVGQGIATSDVDFTPGDNDADDLLSTVLKVGAGAIVAAAGGAAGASMLTEASFRSEFEADECGGTLSRKGWALSRALTAIEDLTKVGEREYAPEVSQLFIVSPSYLNYDTHPPTADRIERLSKLGAQVPTVANIPTIFCSMCGDKTDADGKYCYWCGGNLESLKS